jgi:predicted deacylase
MNPRAQSFHFRHVTYTALKPGPKVLISGAVHGIEVCGPIAINRFLSELDAGAHALIAGSVTFVPVANPLAYSLKQREGDRNLNRNLRPTVEINEFEDYVANWLCPLMAQHDVLLDLHSFRSKGTPFVMVGPPNNDGSLEPFKQAQLEEALATRLGVNRFVHGWLSTYAKGVAERVARLQQRGATASGLHHADYGVGTTEYMRRTGGAALTLECGQNTDPNAPEVAYQAIINTLRHLGVLAGEASAPNASMEVLCIYDVIDKLDTGDTFAKPWASFDPLKAGDLIATRADGAELRAEFDGCMLFPDAGADVDEEWFYVARISHRLTDSPRL